jgi:hypothetical protein
MRRSTYFLLACYLLLSTFCLAKKQQELVMTWPAGSPSLRLTFGSFQEMGSYGGKMSLASQVLVQNLTNKAMARASLKISLLDRQNVRIGDGILIIDDLNPGQSAKVQFQCNSVGPPVALTIAAYNAGGIPTSTLIPITIISVPSGAALKVDDHDVGVTPVTVRVASGSHNLELSKDGYAVAKTPMDVNPDEAPGGSITITLGGLDDDTIELRDGAILKGDVMSMSLESVVIKVNGQDQTFDRNKIKKIFLVERIVTHTVTIQPAGPAGMPASTPAPTNTSPH